MRICIVGKYPPLQGGTSVQTFWLAHRLAQAGCDVTVVAATLAAHDDETVALRADESERLARRFADSRRIRVIELTGEGPDAAAIPATDALVTRLASVALDVIDAQRSEAVISVYLEPFAVAGHLAAASRGLPHLLIHAGSDIVRLAGLHSRRSLYTQVLRDADGILTTPAFAPRLAELRGSSRGLITGRPILAPRALFAEPSQPLDLDLLASSIGAERRASSMFGPRSPRPPVIGMYGKTGPQKGTGALLAAMARLRASGVHGSLLMMTGGAPPALERLRAEVESLSLAEVVSVIPFLPHWRVPEFLASCDCIAFLEHGFSVSEHLPQVPREVATAGRCLLISREAATSVPAAQPLSDGDNVLIVEDPSDPAGLESSVRRALQDAELRDRVAGNGAGLYGWSTEERARHWTQSLISFLTASMEVKRGWSMSLKAFQATVLRIYADPVYRRELSAEPQAINEVGGLSQSEADSLEALLGDRESLDRYCRGIAEKRLHHLESQFSRVLGAHPETAQAIRDEFRDSWVLRDQDRAAEILAFEGLLLSVGAPAVDSERRGAFEQWVRYESVCSRVAGSAGPPAGRPAPSSIDERAELQRAPETELVALDGRPTESGWDVEKGVWRIAAVRHPDRLEARVFEPSAEVWNMLAQLDEPVSLGSLTDALAGDGAPADVRTQAATAIRELLGVGLLRVASPVPEAEL